MADGNLKDKGCPILGLGPERIKGIRLMLSCRGKVCVFYHEENGLEFCDIQQGFRALVRIAGTLEDIKDRLR